MNSRRSGAFGRLPRGLAGTAAGTLLALGLSCGGGGGPEVAPPIPVDLSRSAQELRELLDSIQSRSDTEANLCRARVYGRLRDIERSGSPTLLALGDWADLAVLSHSPSATAQEESASPLAAHFVERAENPILSRASFPGHLGEPLRRIVLLTIASNFAELASRQETAATLEKRASAEVGIAAQEALSPEAIRIWRKWAAQHRDRAASLTRGLEPFEPSADARKFAEADPARHLEEGTRAADRGTGEKADRSDPEDVLRWYLLALAHFDVVRETATQPVPGQEQALGAQDIVVRSLCDILCREP